MSQGQAAPSAELYQDLPALNYHLQLRNLEQQLRTIPKHRTLDRGLVVAKIGIVREKIRRQEAEDAAEEARERAEQLRQAVEYTEPEPQPEPPVVHQTTPSPPPPTYLDALYREAREDIKSTDQKAMFFLAALVWIFVLLVSHNAPAGWFPGRTSWAYKDYVSFASVVGLVGSTYMMLRVLYPRFESFNPVRMLAIKLVWLRRGFWVGIVAVGLALLFLILSKQPHPRSYY